MAFGNVDGNGNPLVSGHNWDNYRIPVSAAGSYYIPVHILDYVM